MWKNYLPVLCSSFSQQPENLQIVLRYELQLSEDTLRDEITKYIPSIVKWTQKYVQRSSGYVFGQTMEKPDNTLTVVDVKDIEENIWSPRWGFITNV